MSDEQLRSDLRRLIDSVEKLVQREPRPDKPWGDMSPEEQIAFTDRKYGEATFDPRGATDAEKIEYIDRHGLDAYKSALRATDE